jgi:hypothetical protein
MTVAPTPSVPLRRVCRGRSAPAAPAAADRLPRVPRQPPMDPQTQARMTALGVRYEGGAYRYEVCRFDRLEDALDFARSQALPLVLRLSSLRLSRAVPRQVPRKVSADSAASVAAAAASALSPTVTTRLRPPRLAR